MIKEVKIENFKSIHSLQLELGRVNVFIGANGSGKSNILEGIAMGSASAEDKLNNEFLASRGIRVTDSEIMKSGFTRKNMKAPIKIQFSIIHENKLEEFIANINNNEKAFNFWHSESYFVNYEKKQKKIDNIRKNFEETVNKLSELTDELTVELTNQQNKFKNKFTKEYINRTQNLTKKQTNQLQKMLDLVQEQISIIEERERIAKHLNNFIIFSPENYFLRRFEEESQIQPLGVKGEGLFRLLSILRESYADQFEEILNNLFMFDWYQGFELPKNLHFTERRIQIKDRFLEAGLQYIDQRSANEGFLYLLFYLSLFISNYTPKFFAIENIDNSLNPKLGGETLKALSALSKIHEKQVIFTTHNPAILDGLNIYDDEQRLFVVSRNKQGHTQIRRIMPIEASESQKPIKLSEQFLRGYIGGLPKNF